MSTHAALGGLDRDELVRLLAKMGEPAYRADQVLQWFYGRRALTFDEMSNLPSSLRTRLAGAMQLFSSRVIETRTDVDGTVKLALALADGHTIESVMIPEAARRTGCLSTQVGCPVGCRFCASGARGFERNLDAAEIVEQALHLARTLPADEHLTHVVFMGIGEGLLNVKSLVRAVRILNAPWAAHLGARRMTVSTVGIPGAILALAEVGLQVNLAVSLHAPSDELRARLIPYKSLARVDDLIDAAEDYYLATGREATFEYVMLAGVNDSPELARELARKIKPCHATVNLIPYNEVEGVPFRTPTPEAVKTFRRVLEEGKVHVTMRRRHGASVAGACGQLRLDALKRQTHG
jgi:23S rRNA (adenine2503-C2)-methyltransferase